MPIVEDAACALGSTYGGKRCGGLGRVACFSFHPRKVITTGEGGLLTTDDAALAERLRRLRNHGQVLENGRGRFVEAGLNYRMTDFQAALGLAQMDRLPAILARRAALARAYEAAFAGLDGRVHAARARRARKPAWQSYVVLLREGIDRDAVQARLRADGIETNLGTYALAAQPHYREHPPLPSSLAAQQRSLAPSPAHAPLRRGRRARGGGGALGGRGAVRPTRRSHGTGAFTPDQFARLGDNVVFEAGVLVFHPETIEIGAEVYVGHQTILKGYHSLAHGHRRRHLDRPAVLLPLRGRADHRLGRGHRTRRPHPDLVAPPGRRRRTASCTRRSSSPPS